MWRQRLTASANFLFMLMALSIFSNSTSAQIDNCCSIDRKCDTNEEWVAGYYARQNNECGAHSPQQQSKSSHSQPQPAASEDNDNCCFIGWQCDSDEDWTSGFWAFQHDHCASQSNWEEQKRKRNSDQPRQNQDDDQPGKQRRRPETVSVVIDVSDFNKVRHDRPDGLTIIINPITRDQMCALFPGIDWCQRR